jgi:hypothetical protein
MGGHRFKLASIIGEVIADLAQHGTTDYEFSLHGLAQL